MEVWMTHTTSSGSRRLPRPRHTLAITVAVVAVVTSLGGGVVGATPEDGPRVRGSLLLAGHDHWNEEGERACVGSGLYGDVRRGMRVAVRDQQGAIVARTILGAGRRTAAGCRLSFVVQLPHTAEYNFEIGRDGAVYQASYDDAGLSYVHRRVSFVVP
jgi:hypothetical protein